MLGRIALQPPRPCGRTLHAMLAEKGFKAHPHVLSDPFRRRKPSPAESSRGSGEFYSRRAGSPLECLDSEMCPPQDERPDCRRSQLGRKVSGRPEERCCSSGGRSRLPDSPASAPSRIEPWTPRQQGLQLGRRSTEHRAQYSAP